MHFLYNYNSSFFFLILYFLKYLTFSKETNEFIYHCNKFIIKTPNIFEIIFVRKSYFGKNCIHFFQFFNFFGLFSSVRLFQSNPPTLLIVLLFASKYFPMLVY